MSDNLPAKFDAEMRMRWLAIYRLCGQLQRACHEVGISPSTVRQLLKNDPDFKDAQEEAYGDFKEQLERELLRRAVMGWEEPVFQQGQLAGTIRKYDSRLLELAIKRHLPEYKESFNVDHNVSGGVLVVPQIEDKSDWEKRNCIDAEIVEDEEHENG